MYVLIQFHHQMAANRHPWSSACGCRNICPLEPDFMYVFVSNSKCIYHQEGECQCRHFVFQHDSDLKQRALLMKNYLQKTTLNVFDWPAQSPDLTPIENVGWTQGRVRTFCMGGRDGGRRFWKGTNENSKMNGHNK